MKKIIVTLTVSMFLVTPLFSNKPQQVKIEDFIATHNFSKLSMALADKNLKVTQEHAIQAAKEVAATEANLNKFDKRGVAKAVIGVVAGVTGAMGLHALWLQGVKRRSVNKLVLFFAAATPVLAYTAITSLWSGLKSSRQSDYQKACAIQLLVEKRLSNAK